MFGNGRSGFWVDVVWINEYLIGTTIKSVAYEMEPWVGEE
jgi:hypothetical protein